MFTWIFRESTRSTSGRVEDRDKDAALTIKAVGVEAAQRTLRTEVTKFDEAFIKVMENFS